MHRLAQKIIFILFNWHQGPKMKFTRHQMLPLDDVFLAFILKEKAPVVPGQIKELTLFHGGCAASQQEGAGPGGDSNALIRSRVRISDGKVPSPRSNKLVTHAALHSKASDVLSPWPSASSARLKIMTSIVLRSSAL